MEKVINIEQAQKAKKDPIDYLSDNVVLLSLNENFDVLSANETFLKVTGIDKNTLDRLNFFQHLCSELPDYIQDELSYLLRQQKSWNGNFAFSNVNGPSSWFHTNIIPSRDENGTYIGFNLLATVGKSQQSMITEKETTESWMKAIFNDADEVNILIGLDGDVIEFNAMAYEFFSWYTHKELRLNEFIFHYFGSSFSNTFKALFEKTKNGHKQKFCRSFKNLSGYEKVMDMELKPVSNSAGNIMGIILTSTDITEEVNLEKRIKASEKKLDDIAFINAHEVRAPLASILGLLNLLDFEEVNEDSKVILNHLKSSAFNLEKIILKVSESTYISYPDSIKSA
ncbi:PAS domain-containing protein [Marivirga harenae]|uniref:PAS domain-containing protein n=1 Tax=Marivirga harenae TaxID=2010992 RepID=UPI0026E0E00A|nr:PAS domain-containing protein [Marivirga harenae]WKV13398.1 PAS domain-containing protein [Marivirga harenae]